MCGVETYNTASKKDRVWYEAAERNEHYKNENAWKV